MIANDDDDDGPPQLSAETLKALQEWQQEQEENKAANVPQEDWVNIFAAHIILVNFEIVLAIESILVQS
jgi:hypothetical protein